MSALPPPPTPTLSTTKQEDQITSDQNLLLHASQGLHSNFLNQYCYLNGRSETEKPSESVFGTRSEALKNLRTFGFVFPLSQILHCPTLTLTLTLINFQ